MARFRHLLNAFTMLSRAGRDAVVLALLFGPALALLISLDAFDTFYEFSRSHEAWELDEIVTTVFLGGFAAFIFGMRRLTDLKHEVRQRRAAEHTAVQLALHDTMTGLPNRKQFERKFTAAISSAQEPQRAVMMINIDGFKQVNDTFGHGVGDALLLAAADRLVAAIGPHGFVARLNGDEFAVATGPIKHTVDATRVARQLMSVLHAPFPVHGHKISVSVGVGVARMPEDGTTVTELLRRADIAMRRAKLGGRAGFSFFEEGMDAAVARRGQMESRLRAAIGEGLVEPYFQPIQSLTTGRTVAFECLARWNDSELGFVPPDQFIPMAEDCGLIAPLSDMLLKRACYEAQSWPAEVRLSFNLSAVQLRERTLGLKILSTLGELNFDPRRLELEITESALVSDVAVARETLNMLSQTGIRIALDDFGTGHSSLRYIREFPIDKLKIDQSFVRTLDTKPESEQIVRAVVGLSQGLGIEATAEGIEEETHLALLKSLNCEYGQGYLFGKPMPAAEARAFVGVATGAAAARLGA